MAQRASLKGWEECKIFNLISKIQQVLMKKVVEHIISTQKLKNLLGNIQEQ